MERSDFEVAVESSDDLTVVHVRGELDLATTPELDEAIGDAVGSGRLVLDLTECTFVDSSAIRALLGAARAQRQAGGTSSLVAVDPGVLRALEIAGVEQALPIRASVSDALQ